MNNKNNRGRVIKLTLLFMSLYLVSYITRINYGAVISEIVKAEGILKSQASLALTASAVTYGAGQLVSGFLGDRFNPKKLIFGGLLTTMITNLLLPCCADTYQMTAVWAVNGFAQAFMWPPLVRIMTKVFERDDYNTACMIVSCAASVGTILVYAVSPVCIYFVGWKFVFAVSALCALIMSVVWMKACPDVKEKSQKVQAVESHKMPASVCVFIVVLMLGIIMQGILRDGVTTWMPSYISEVFNLDNKITILTGVILPIFSIVITNITSFLYRKFIRNEMLLASIIFGVGMFASVILFFANGVSPAVSILLSAMLTGCTHGVNWIVTCMMPPKFERYGKISFISGLLNSGTYIGSSISVYGMALFSEKMGWDATVLLWAGIALAGTVIFLVLSLRKKQINI